MKPIVRSLVLAAFVIVAFGAAHPVMAASAVSTMSIVDLSSNSVTVSGALDNSKILGTYKRTTISNLTADINFIIFGDQNGKMLGTYEQAAPGEWVETDVNNKVTFSFKEVKRDETSIYISDASRNIDLQLDLKAMTVIYDNGILYSILKAEHNLTIGMNLITFGDQNGKMLGTYEQTARGEWVETDVNNKVTFSFKEVKRDETSIYINDASRKIDLQLDLKAMTVIYDNGILYSILKAEHDFTIGMNLITFGDQNGKMLGTYKQTAPGKWVETDDKNKVRFSFKEVKRDETSIYINDASRKIDLQLDLKAMTVIYDNGILYSILKAE